MRSLRTLLLPTALICASACGLDSPAQIDMQEVVDGEANGTLFGYLSVRPGGDGVHISGGLGSLPPGRYGLHVRSEGCDSGHFDPTGKRHGDLGDPESHAGDLGNIEVDADGEVDIDITTTKMKYDHDGSGLLGHVLVLSAAEDDLTTQPDGNAGKALACGRIEIPGE